jgi:uncharacterized phiE125 gp8 family phage protein
MWYGWTTVTAPTEEPVSLTEAKLYLRIDVATEDAQISAQIAAARLWLENVLRQSLVTRTLEHRLDAWPAPAYRLPMGPVQSVTSVTYTDTDGAAGTVGASNYTLVDGRLLLADNDATWPSVSLRGLAGVAVRYVAGYGAAAAVPADLKQFVLAHLAVQWFNRDEIASDAERQVKRLETNLRGMYGREL